MPAIRISAPQNKSFIVTLVSILEIEFPSSIFYLICIWLQTPCESDSATPNCCEVDRLNFDLKSTSKSGQILIEKNVKLSENI